MATEPLTRDSLYAQIATLGVTPGDGLFVHASLGAMGHVKGGPATVIDALRDSVGSGGLIGMPAFSTDAYFPPDIDRKALTPSQIAAIAREVTGHDPERSDCALVGAIAERFRTTPGVLRSSHPCVSVCLAGSGARNFCAPHPIDWATGPDSPLGRLAKRPGMKVLLIGVGWNRCSLLHTAETLAYHRRTKIRRFKTGPGAALWVETPDVADDNDRLFPAVGAAFERTGAVAPGTLGEAEVKLCTFAELLEFATAWIDTRNRADEVRRYVR